MTHYLRWRDDTIAEAEATKDDISTGVVIRVFGELLRCTPTKCEEIIADFDFVQEMRGAWHEDVEQCESPDEFVRNRFREIERKYHGLKYMTG